MEIKKYYNSEEVAKIIGIEVSTLNTLRKKGLIRAYVLGYKMIRYDDAQIKEYMENPHTVKAGEK